eukprot:2803753-Prymnesium_polylepis.1
MQTASDAHDDDVKRRRLMDGPAPALHDSVTAGCAPVVPVGTDVRNWLHKIGFGQYADGLIAKGLDDLQYLQQKVDLKELKKRLRKDNTMLTFHLDKFISKLHECRAPIDKAGASIAPLTSWAPDATSSAAASSSAVEEHLERPASTSSIVQDDMEQTRIRPMKPQKITKLLSPMDPGGKGTGNIT